MFEPIKIPANHVMLYNVAKLKPGYTVEDAELALGEMCEVVKETYSEFYGLVDVEYITTALDKRQVASS